MAGVKYQNPNDANVTSTLDSAICFPTYDTSVAAGPVEVRREILLIGDSAGTNVMSQLLATQMDMLAELKLIRYALGKLIGEHLVPDARDGRFS